MRLHENFIICRFYGHDENEFGKFRECAPDSHPFSVVRKCPWPLRIIDISFESIYIKKTVAARVKVASTTRCISEKFRVLLKLGGNPLLKGLP